METILIFSSILLWVMVLLNMLWTLGLARRIRNATPVIDSLMVGQKAPNFSAQTIQGNTITIADYAGRTAALVFISPHCQPCREELPHLQALSAKAKEFGTELVLVSDEGEETTRPFVDGTIKDLTVLIAPRSHNSLFTDYKVPGTPSFCLLDVHGKIHGTGVGSSDLTEKLEELSKSTKGGT